MPRIESRDRKEEAVALGLAGAGLVVAAGRFLVEETAKAGGDVKERLEHRRLAHAGPIGHAAVAQPGEAPHLKLVEPLESAERRPIAA